MAPEMEKAIVIKDGIVTDENIIAYRKKMGLII